MLARQKLLHKTEPRIRTWTSSEQSSPKNLPEKGEPLCQIDAKTNYQVSSMITLNLFSLEHLGLLNSYLEISTASD